MIFAILRDRHGARLPNRHLVLLGALNPASPTGAETVLSMYRPRFFSPRTCCFLVDLRPHFSLPSQPFGPCQRRVMRSASGTRAALGLLSLLLAVVGSKASEHGAHGGCSAWTIVWHTQVRKRPETRTGEGEGGAFP